MRTTRERSGGTATLMAYIVAKVERERVLCKLSGRNEGIHRGGNMVDRDRVPAKAENTVELANAVAKSETGSVVHLREEVVVEGVVTDLHIVTRVISRDGARTVLNLELSTVSLVRRRLRVVVDLMGREELCRQAKWLSS